MRYSFNEKVVSAKLSFRNSSASIFYRFLWPLLQLYVSKHPRGGFCMETSCV